MSAIDFLVDRTDLSNTELKDTAVPVAGQGEVLIKVERFALTANNITYGVAGDMIGYWQFFPASENQGRIPVWGIGEVETSNCPGLEIGDRIYGYYPMSTYLVVKPEKVTPRGFHDGSAHRQQLPPAYNGYSLMTEDNGFETKFDNHEMLYRPLFTTSFVLDDFFADNQFFGAKQIILSSASSKTAFGMAFLLKDRDIKVIGLTSAGNVDFVKQLNLYDDVVTYDTIAQLDASTPAAYVDMAGNRTVLTDIHNHFTDNLKYSCGVGITHYDERAGADPKTLPGAKPSMFFAPSQIIKRNGEWGPAVFQSKLSEAWKRFIKDVDNWVTIQESKAPAELNETYQTVLAGPKPDKGYVVVM